MKTWETKDGRIVKIKEMTDEHLLNVVRFVERRAKEGVQIGGGEYYGEGENSFWWDVVYGEEAKGCFAGYKDIIKEIKKRGLKEIK